MAKTKKENGIIKHILKLLEDSPKDDHDAIFKQVLTSFFKDFIEMFLPILALQIDFNNIEFIDKEIFHHGTSRSRTFLDLVCKASMLDKNQKEKLILVHIEVQSTKDNKMAERMLDYYCHLRIKHHLDVVPIVLFADDAKWRKEVKNSYDMSFNNETFLHFEYKQIKLKHLNVKDYMNSKKPLAYALMAKMDLSHVDKKELMGQIAKFISNGRISKNKQALLYTMCYKYLILNNEDREVFNDSLEGITLEEKGKIGEIMMNFDQKIGYEKGKAETIINLALDGDLPMEKARKKVESLKDLLPPDFYAQIIKKLN
ncbi:MAG: hypothetical protein COB02_07675 [Candidatus Cloacimonadota bacterium]|nr:MAG: hypothetical protein COB02_07675 [Candidatus Cloacimonadota bacterium]